MSEGDAPKIQIDSDWKAQAQAEKQRLAEQSKKKQEEQAAASAGSGGAAGTATAGAGASGGGAGQQQMPPASFETLISTMTTQALFAMGAIPDPRTGQRVAHLELARHHIDMLSILEEKTEGNLTDEETNLLKQTLYELRQRYIQLATQARNQTYS